MASDAAPAAPRAAGPMAVAPHDREAAERLIGESYRTIYRALCRMAGDPEIAADLTQETYRRAWVALPSFEGRCAFTTWLYRIAYTTYLNHRRQRPEPGPLPEGVAEIAAPPVDPEPDAARLREAVMALPEQLRYVVTAHYWAERPVREIAAEEGVSTVAIRKRMRRAVELLAVDLGAKKL